MFSSYKHLAMQMATQLPDTQEEARAVVEFLRELVENWVYEPVLAKNDDDACDLGSETNVTRLKLPRAQ